MEFDILGFSIGLGFSFLSFWIGYKTGKAMWTNVVTVETHTTSNEKHEVKK